MLYNIKASYRIATIHIDTLERSVLCVIKYFSLPPFLQYQGLCPGYWWPSDKRRPEERQSLYSEKFLYFAVNNMYNILNMYNADFWPQLSVYVANFLCTKSKLSLDREQ